MTESEQHGGVHPSHFQGQPAAAAGQPMKARRHAGSQPPPVLLQVQNQIQAQSPQAMLQHQQRQKLPGQQNPQYGNGPQYANAPNYGPQYGNAPQNQGIPKMGNNMQGSHAGSQAPMSMSASGAQYVA